MIQVIIKLYRKFRNLILYGIIGCFTSSLDFAVYTILTNFCGVFYLISNCISVLIGITTSFLLNRTYNFKVKNKTGQRFVIFLGVGLMGLCLSNVILWVCIERLLLNKVISKLASIVLVVFFQFLLNKYITFRHKD